MSWFNKPKYKNVKFQNEKSLPQGVWIKCDKCRKASFKKKIAENCNICINCGFHFNMSSKDRIDLLIDKGTFQEFNRKLTSADPLKFKDANGSYLDKVNKTREKLKINEGVITGEGRINGLPVVLSVMEFSFLGGSMGSAVGEKIYQAMMRTVKKKYPLVIVSSSGGARMHEGLLSLMQMAKTCSGLQIIEDKNIPFISVLTNPTFGGVTASFASMGDIIIAEPNTLIGFAGPRVIEQTIKQKLPKDFQTSEFLKDKGFIDMVVDRRQLKEKITKTLKFFQN